MIGKASQKAYLTSLNVDGRVTLLENSGYWHPVYFIHSLYGIIHHMLSLSETPGLNSLVTLPLTA